MLLTMIYILLFIIVIAILLLPQWWIKRVINKHSHERPDIKGSGAEFAQHLISRLNLDISVEETKEGDHYSPNEKVVRLSKQHFHQRSLAAMVIAAHEVGHAIQDQQQDKHFLRSIRLSQLSFWVQKIAPIALSVSPILLALTKSPALSMLTLLIGVAAVGVGTLVTLCNLPVEFDASFNKAMPLLKSGEYFSNEADYVAANKILKAAAYTYVAGSLFNLLNLAYWLRLFRR